MAGFFFAFRKARERGKEISDEPGFICYIMYTALVPKCFGTSINCMVFYD